jgi:hypothetical protein
MSAVLSLGAGGVVGVCSLAPHAYAESIIPAIATIMIFFIVFIFFSSDIIILSKSAGQKQKTRP